EPRVEVAGIVHEHIDAAEAIHASSHRCLGILRTGHVELDDKQVVGLTERAGDGVGVAARGNDGMSSGARRLYDVDTHATAGTGHEPDALISHGKSSR